MNNFKINAVKRNTQNKCLEILYIVKHNMYISRVIYKHISGHEH